MSVPPSAAEPAGSPQSVLPLSPRLIAALFGASVVACLIVYLAIALPARWFSSVPDASYGARQLVMSRG
ncbi:MAG TPA: hypothetical protein VIF33_09280, partial [Casimicrobiaceae bacterium]